MMGLLFHLRGFTLAISSRINRSFSLVSSGPDKASRRGHLGEGGGDASVENAPDRHTPVVEPGPGGRGIGI